MQIENHVAVITGGASGLGEATARRIIDRGGKVVALDLNEERGESIEGEFSGEYLFVKTDVTDEASVTASLDRAVSHFGAIHFLISCAGIAPPEKTFGRRGSHRLSTFSKVVEVNLIGTFNVIRLVAERFSENPPNEHGEQGVIVNTASVAAFDGQIGQAAYGASKAGVAGMTLPIARDLSVHGIRVMAIAPGLFETPMFEQLPESARQALGEMTPFPKRLGKPDEYAKLVESILTNPMLNGETSRLDGAIRMQPK